MIYKYRYTGEQDISLPTHGIFAKAFKENEAQQVYETTEPINHPDFYLTEEVAEQHEENTQQENVSHEGDTQVE